MIASPQSLLVTLAEAVEGMILATALLDEHGSVLLPQDAVLTAAILKSLHRRGIQQCVVKLPPLLPDLAAIMHAQEQQLRRLEHLFRYSASSDGGAELLHRLRAYRENLLV